MGHIRNCYGTSVWPTPVVFGYFYGVKRRIVFTPLLCSLTAICLGQNAPSREQWGEQFNSPGAKLTYKETERARTPEKTVITYNLFASGLPKNSHYVLWALHVGDDPQVISDPYWNDQGKLVRVLADSEHHIAEDPIEVKVSGGKGEPTQFALISDDGQSRAFAEIVPFPMDVNQGPCHLSAVETGPYYFGMLIKLTGLQPDEELLVDRRSEGEGGQSKAKADEQGSYKANFFPRVKGENSGMAKFRVSAKSCKIGIEFPWGEGSYQYQ
jgi:hypothetical protein